jgi:hypothetical protein
MTLHRGRIQSELQILGIRELSRDDLDCVKEKRNVPAVQRFRDPHHRLARLLASGLRPAEAATQVGYSLARIYILQVDPAFQDLVSAYRKDVHEAYISAEEERHRAATEVNLKALRHLNEHFDKADEEGELVPISRALAVFADTSDRVGLSKKSTNVNINVDFAAKLESAIARSSRARLVNGPSLPTPALPSQARQMAPPAQRTYIEGNLVRKI